MVQGVTGLLCLGVDNCDELVNGVQEDVEYVVEVVWVVVSAPPGQYSLVYLRYDSVRQTHRLMQPNPYHSNPRYRPAKLNPRKHGPPDALDRVRYLLYLLYVDGFALHWRSPSLLLLQNG